MTVAGLVLAAGGGSRFSGDGHKLLAPFRGRPVVAWALEAAAAAGFDRLYVVTGAVDLGGLLPAGAVEVANPSWAEGQATSLAAGIAAVEADGHDVVVVGLGDQPLVPVEAWRLVAAGTTPITTATFDGRRRPPVRLDRSVWDRLPRTGDLGARALIRDGGAEVSEVACSGSPVDIDTLEDLRRWS